MLLPTLGRPTMATMGRDPLAFAGSGSRLLLLIGLELGSRATARVFTFLKRLLAEGKSTRKRRVTGPAFLHPDPEFHVHTLVEKLRERLS